MVWPGLAGLLGLTVTGVFALTELGGRSSGAQRASNTISQAPARPRLTGAANAVFTVGAYGDFSVAADQIDAVLTEQGPLPSGLRYTPGPNGTGRIYGTPLAGAGGLHPISVTATGRAGSTGRQVMLSVSERPGFTSSTSFWGVVGVGVHDPIRTTGYPAPRLSISGVLPPGLTFADHGDGTGLVSGSPEFSLSGINGLLDLLHLAYREYTVQVTATNATGSTTFGVTFHVLFS